MVTIVFIGFGNVNQQLCRAFRASNDVFVKQVFNRNFIKFAAPYEGISFTDSLSTLEEADIYIMGIPDDAIASVSENLPFQNRLVVHTSGGITIDNLSPKNRKGVFYPLQTFSKNRKVVFDNIPICIEAESTSDLEILEKLGNIISENVMEISSEKRAELHLAAVFVNNFVNYLYEIGSKLLKEKNLPFQLLQPLILETAQKIEDLSPKEAQTGPAKRGDEKTIEKHLKLLGDSHYKKFYKLFTETLKSET